MVCKLGNVEQVTDQLTHHLTGVVLTVIGKGQLFIVFEEFLNTDEVASVTIGGTEITLP